MVFVIYGVKLHVHLKEQQCTVELMEIYLLHRILKYFKRLCIICFFKLKQEKTKNMKKMNRIIFIISEPFCIAFSNDE
jgi:hypothetical protein